MRIQADKIEVKDPPIQEFSKKHSCLKRTCLTGCGCIVVFIIASLAILKFTVGPKTKELKELPPAFLETIPLYDRDSIVKILYTTGEDRGKNVERIAYIPKMAMGPVVAWLNRNEHKKGAEAIESYWDTMITFIQEPVADHRDVIMIEWTNLSADDEFIAQFYKTELKKKQFTIKAESANDNVHQFVFSKKNIEGLLYVNDTKKTKGTDSVKMQVKMRIE